MTAEPAAEPPISWARVARGSAPVLGVMAVALAFQLPIFDRWFSFMDEGHMLLYADLIANGGELYRDATVYPLPGAFYLLALIFQVFEPSNLVARWVVMIEFTAFAGLIFMLLRRALPLHYALSGVALLLVYRVWAFPQWQMYNYSTTALLIQMAALLTLLRALEAESRRAVAAAGLLFGFGVLVKQDYGAAALLVFTSLLILDSATRKGPAAPSTAALLGSFFAPAVAVGAATGLYFWHHGLLAELLQFTVFNHFVGMSHYPYSTFPSLIPLYQQDELIRGPAGSAFLPGILLTADWRSIGASDLYRETAVVDAALKLYYYLPYFYAVGAGLRLCWCRRELRDAASRRRYLVEYALWAFGAAFVLLVTFNRPQDYVHLAVLYFPFLLLPVIHVHALLRGRRPLAWLLALLMLPPAGAALSYTGLLWWRIRSDHTAPIDSPRARILVTPSQARLFDELLGHIRENSAPGEPVAVMPYFPLLTFYAERRGPHRSSYIVWPFPEFPDRDRQVIEAMERTRTELVVYNFTQFMVFDRVSEYAPELYEYLVNDWEIERIFATEGWGYTLAALRRRVEPRAALLSDTSRSSVHLTAELTPPRPIEPDELASWVRVESWPFRPTLAMRPSSGGRTVLSVPAGVPPEARLKTAVSVHPKRWYEGDRVWAEFELVVVDGERRSSVFQRRLQPGSHAGDRGWIEVEVPLSEWAGRQVVLEFSTGTNKRSGESLLQAGWAEPRIEAPGRTEEQGELP